MDEEFRGDDGSAAQDGRSPSPPAGEPQDVAPRTALREALQEYEEEHGAITDDELEAARRRHGW